MRLLDTAVGQPSVRATLYAYLDERRLPPSWQHVIPVTTRDGTAFSRHPRLDGYQAGRDQHGLHVTVGHGDLKQWYRWPNRDDWARLPIVAVAATCPVSYEIVRYPTYGHLASGMDALITHLMGHPIVLMPGWEDLTTIAAD